MEALLTILAGVFALAVVAGGVAYFALRQQIFRRLEPGELDRNEKAAKRAAQGEEQIDLDEWMRGKDE